MRELDDITQAIIEAAIQIHRDLGLRVAAPPREPIGAESVAKSVAENFD